MEWGAGATPLSAEFWLFFFCHEVLDYSAIRQNDPKCPNLPSIICCKVDLLSQNSLINQDPLLRQIWIFEVVQEIGTWSSGKYTVGHQHPLLYGPIGY